MDKLKPCPNCENLKHPDFPCIRCYPLNPVFVRRPASNTNTDTALAAAEARIVELESQVSELQSRRENMHYDMLLWRGITPDFDKVCRSCSGAGIKVYGSTSTWRGGIGGQMMTSDVCDKCWGSGKEEKPWLSHRHAAALLKEKE